VWDLRLSHAHHHHHHYQWAASRPVRIPGSCHPQGSQHPMGRIKGHFWRLSALLGVSRYLLLASACPAKGLGSRIKFILTPLQHQACCKHPVNKNIIESAGRKLLGCLHTLQIKCRRQRRGRRQEAGLTMSRGLPQRTRHSRLAWLDPSAGTLCCMSIKPKRRC